MEHPLTRTPRRGAFRINARNIFITWPRLDTNIEDLQEWLLLKIPISHCIVARELHQDGTPHFHAYLQLAKKTDIRDQAYFNYQNHQANIGPVRNIQAAITYCKKDGSFLEHFNEGINNPFNPYDLAKEVELPTYYETCRKMKVSYQYAKEAWNYQKSMENDINTISGDQPILGSILNPYLLLLRPEANVTNWIKGPSGIGKTTWALTHAEKPALFVRHLDTLKQFRIGYHKTIIFDDMSFSHQPRTAQIMIVDTDHPQQIHIRYSVVNLPAKITKIFLSNDDIFIEDTAIKRRIKSFII